MEQLSQLTKYHAGRYNISRSKFSMDDDYLDNELLKYLS